MRDSFYLYAMNLTDLFQSHFGFAPVGEIVALAQAGSDRRYYRLFLPDGSSVIGAVSKDIVENKTFIAFTDYFAQQGIAVPKVLAVNEDSSIYLLQDLGDISLLQYLAQKGTEAALPFYEQALKLLAKMQTQTEGLNYSLCLHGQDFDAKAILRDCQYFNYYFLRPHKLHFDEEVLELELEALANYLADPKAPFASGFMFRDFQARNIMVQEAKVWFIDYQGGKRGAAAYDAASLLFQAKAALAPSVRESLLDYYIQALQEYAVFDIDDFKTRYDGFVLIRLLQTLGSYGFRGLFERREHFLESIPYGLQNVKWWLDNARLPFDMPELRQLLTQLTSDAIIARYTPPRATSSTALTIDIKSFSYKKGIPSDSSANGGGFVFDCRGLLNPGRFDDYKCQSGLDASVQKFLMEQTQMPSFLQHLWGTVDISIEDYLARNFEHLCIYFGCTGGQHRSVFAAEQTAAHLRRKYGVNVKVEHTNVDNWLRTKPQDTPT